MCVISLVPKFRDILMGISTISGAEKNYENLQDSKEEREEANV